MRKTIVMAAGAALVAATVGIGNASAQAATGDPGVITVCVNTDSGLMRLVGQSAKCKRNESLLSWNVQGAQGPAGVAGPAGPQGPAGANGVDGASGASNGYFWNSTSAQNLTNGMTIVTQGPMTSEGLPAGSYIVTGTAQLTNVTSETTTTDCFLSAHSNVSSSAAVTLPPGARGSVAVTWGYVTASAGAHVSLTCTGVSGVQSTSAQITAVKVGALN